MAIHRAVLDCLAALAITVALLFAVPASAQTFPEHRGSPVVDQADLLRPEQELDLKSKSEALYAQTGRAFVVATVDSLDGLTIEDYGNRLLRQWKVGDEKRDDGVILLVAPNEKKVRIETGYGAEGFLPDILAGRIIRNEILPRFREGDMASGIMEGANSIVKQMSLPPGQAQEAAKRAEAQDSKQHRSSGGALPVIFWLMVIGFVLLSFARRAGGRRYRSRRGGISPWIVLWGLSEAARASRRGGHWGGGSWGGGGGFGGGGFGGFGGGSGGGGGASGSW